MIPAWGYYGNMINKAVKHVQVYLCLILLWKYLGVALLVPTANAC
jgi:hypothetical protein